MQNTTAKTHEPLEQHREGSVRRGIGMKNPLGGSPSWHSADA